MITTDNSPLVIAFAGGIMVMLDETHILDTVDALQDAGITFAVRHMTEAEAAEYSAALASI